MADHYSLAVHGPRATITFDNAAERNSIDPAQLPLLNRLLGEVEADPALRVLVFQTAGGPVFSSGYSLSKVQDADPFHHPLEATVDRIAALPVMTVCALNGSVYGGAVDLTQGFDFRIGVAGMLLYVPAGALGVHYYANGLRRAVELVGLSHAKRIFVLCEKYDDAGLVRAGYLDALTPADELDATIDAFATRLSGFAPLAQKGMKQALNQIARRALDEDSVRKTIVACMESDDAREGPRAFAEKRRALFRGR